LPHRKAERLERLNMDGDESMALLAIIARADLAEAFDPETERCCRCTSGRWRSRLAVKSVKRGAITFHNS
jgi:hypothetical protein